MATVTGLTAERMQEIIDDTIIDANIVGDNLILLKHDASIIDAGSVRGPIGVTGATGDLGMILVQPGVVDLGDCALTINTTAQVTIAAGTVIVPTTPISKAIPALTVLGGIPAAVNNRLDQIVCSSAGVISRLAGTSDLAGNTLANRTGNAAIPAGSQLLYDILVTSGGVLAANVRDRRPWARGFFKNTTIGAQTRNGASPAVQLIVGTRFRVECTGKPLRFELSGLVTINALWTAFRLYVDGVQAAGVQSDQYASSNGGNVSNGPLFDLTYTPPAGSHLFEIQNSNGGGATSTAIGANGLQWTIEELIRQNADNGTI